MSFLVYANSLCLGSAMTSRLDANPCFASIIHRPALKSAVSCYFDAHLACCYVEVPKHVAITDARQRFGISCFDWAFGSRICA
ncbi:hypothetical protein FB567DRAFT_333550 [Paraphoma chrysanthemicola]|uniref:Uncharacterized protein n=1 Tax=Paraphoma chrysanthemicola TaxID=798071 RepID=A0A8K0R6M5_9PLEO|nr:hypothetical protein FB567DRAFT_333550 [Paraphoma chrysanthemicola]